MGIPNKTLSVLTWSWHKLFDQNYKADSSVSITEYKFSTTETKFPETYDIQGLEITFDLTPVENPAPLLTYKAQEIRFWSPKIVQSFWTSSENTKSFKVFNNHNFLPVFKSFKVFKHRSKFLANVQSF